jgi:hypothetical protein
MFNYTLACPLKKQWTALHALNSKEDETVMAVVSIDADIKAKWPQGQCSHSPGSPEELAIIAVDLLVKELGTEGAQAFIDQVLGRYPSQQKEL